MRRLGIYAHYDGDGEVKAFVSHSLAELRKVCEHIVFVTTAELTEQGAADARRGADHVIQKENIGLDFGMWQRALAEVDYRAFDEVVLTNSSVFGPLSPLADCFSRMAASDCHFWGMTENFEVAWHLQSYFLVFRPPVVRSETFADFWRGVLPYRDKAQIIRSYEVGLSRYLVDHGFRAAALVPSAELFPPFPIERFFPFKRRNPTVFYPERLLDRGMPLVKVELLRDNPIDVPLEPIRRRMVALGYPSSLIAFDRAPRPKGRLPMHPLFTFVQKPGYELAGQLVPGLR